MRFSLLTFADSLTPIMPAPKEGQVFPQNYCSEKEELLSVTTLRKSISELFLNLFRKQFFQDNALLGNWP